MSLLEISLFCSSRSTDLPTIAISGCLPTPLPIFHRLDYYMWPSCPSREIFNAHTGRSMTCLLHIYECFLSNRLDSGSSSVTHSVSQSVSFLGPELSKFAPFSIELDSLLSTWTCVDEREVPKVLWVNFAIAQVRSLIDFKHVSECQWRAIALKEPI